ncbi:MAG: DNA protecting protein DprA [Desulfobacula sp. RIFOXYA12_FULL_46_16]|nr:MAG: DNA protecting protein DprA [Deltaproteobacteria bacterium RIFOXYC2_FULL_48_10]OGR20854.1 MAG: DNA protecting protein DprA [Desulfobacula sp. RIFOXYA12_FULL_46_16]OGR35454.1 MAG: DNA protecting protein DprA [Desulfobacula sp. RIFOXYB2_FULL_45_6]
MQTFFDKYLPWFVLREIPFLGNTLYKKLIDRFQSPETVLTASKAEFESIGKISTKTLYGLLHHKLFMEQAKIELEQIFKNHIHIVTLNDAFYPVLLKQIQDPPPFLTYYGTLDNESPCVSIVGSRTATSYGLSTSENLSFKLASKGFQIVSGLARGIDAMAHKGALRAKGKTIAVLGSGLKKIYPKENESLFHEIAETGTIFSEFKVNADPIPGHFPVRNRIIAGLSCGSIVVEAAKRSGSLITARLASEYNREVFAVPGSIKSKKSEGTHSLLKQGAKLVETEMDIIDEFHHFIHKKKETLSQVPLESSESGSYPGRIQDRPRILNFLEPYPVHIDIIIEKSGMKSSEVASQLLDLELEGLVNRHQGNCYSISEDYH